jgi:hypothetical protein
VNIEDEEHSPDDAKDGEWSPPSMGCHSIELKGSQESYYSYYYGEPRVAEPNSS